MAPKKKAKWTLGAHSKTVNADGRAMLSCPLLDDGKKQGVIRVEMTDKRELLVTWKGEPGTEPLTDFRAWSKEG